MLAFLLSTTSVIEKNTWISTTKNDSFTAYSKQESIYPHSKGLVQLKLEAPVTWTNEGNCNTKSVFIRNEDTHLISVALSVKAANVSIKLYADDTLKVKQRYYLRAISLH